MIRFARLPYVLLKERFYGGDISGVKLVHGFAFDSKEGLADCDDQLSPVRDGEVPHSTDWKWCTNFHKAVDEFPKFEHPLGLVLEQLVLAERVHGDQPGAVVHCNLQQSK